METLACKIEGCERPAKTLGCCSRCYQSNRKKSFTDPCAVDGCPNTMEHPTTGRCHACHERLRLSQITATCQREACDRQIVNIALRLCGPHYLEYQDLQQTERCIVDGCDNIAKAGGRGFCGACYQQNRVQEMGQSCGFTDCNNLVYAGDLCPGHQAQQRDGKSLSPLRALNPRGMGNLDPTGYINIVRDGRKQGEHRWVMEDILGRELLPGENVHHKNGVRHDNRPENLELWVTPQPSGARLCDLLEWAHYLIDTYEN